jgi:REP element-mobilizing transposase RayT
MRQPRIKLDDQPAWYHCYNRVAGTSRDRPFGEVEKEQFVRILQRVCELYTVEVMSYQVMSNHYHLLVHAPEETPDAEEVCKRYERFHHGRRTLKPGSKACRQWQARCRDISWFMRHLQQLFTCWFNRTRKVRRRGALWAGRFKHTVLESGLAVWRCWAYIENNPVRAGITRCIAEYRFCSHGIWCQSGRHPFADNVIRRALPMLSHLFGFTNITELKTHMDAILADEGGTVTESSGFTTQVGRRVRHWTDGLIIGSRVFLCDVMARHRPQQAVKRHRLATTSENIHSELCAWRRVRDSVAP